MKQARHTNQTPYDLTHARNPKSWSPRHGEAIVIRDMGKQEEREVGWMDTMTAM